MEAGTGQEVDVGLIPEWWNLQTETGWDHVNRFCMLAKL